MLDVLRPSQEHVCVLKSSTRGENEMSNSSHRIHPYGSFNKKCNPGKTKHNCCSYIMRIWSAKEPWLFRSEFGDVEDQCFLVMQLCSCIFIEGWVFFGWSPFLFNANCGCSCSETLGIGWHRSCSKWINVLKQINHYMAYCTWDILSYGYISHDMLNQRLD